ncbi:MAG: hypothetical protein ACI4ET_12575 [Bilifractor sp.]
MEAEDLDLKWEEMKEAIERGLLFEIKTGFREGYREYSLLLDVGRQISGGGADPEADMTTYESYSRDFNQELMNGLEFAFDNDTGDSEKILEEVFPDKNDLDEADFEYAIDYERKRLHDITDDRITSGN